MNFGATAIAKPHSDSARSAVSTLTDCSRYGHASHTEPIGNFVLLKAFLPSGAADLFAELGGVVDQRSDMIHISIICLVVRQCAIF